MGVHEDCIASNKQAEGFLLQDAELPCAARLPAQ